MFTSRRVVGVVSSRSTYNSLPGQMASCITDLFFLGEVADSFTVKNFWITK
jgi:hypothetical protein